MEIGKLLKDGRKKKGLTQAEVQEHIGIHCKTLANYERGVHKPSLETLLLLFDFYGIDSNATIGLQSPSMLKRIPVLSMKKSYRDKEEVYLAEEPLYYEMADIDQPKDYLFFEIPDDKMKDYRLREGDAVLVEKTNTPEDGSIVVVMMDGQLMARKLKKIGDGMYSLVTGEFSGNDTITVNTKDPSVQTVEMIGVARKLVSKL